MKIGITQRLFLAILLATALALASMAVVMQWSIDRGFLRYVNTVEKTMVARLAGKLEESYAREGSWDHLRRDPARWSRLVAESLPEDEGPPPGRALHGHPPERPSGANDAPPPRPLPPHLVRRFALRVFLLDAERRPLLAPAEIPGDADLKPLRQQERIVGYLGLLPRRNLSDEPQLRFLKEQKLALCLVAGIAFLVAAGLSLPLAGRLVRPIRALTEATDRLAAGEYAARVPVTSTDELGQLARDFNALALALEKNEQARRQWVADISHELRTPLAVLRGEIEALQDGVRPTTPAALHSLHGEVTRLSRLVDDLYQLSLSDLGALTYRKEEVDLAGVLVEVLEQYKPEFDRERIDLRTESLPATGLLIFADRERLRQLFANLLDNTLKYTDAGGALEVRLERQNSHAVIHFRDTCPGVPAEELARLFDRLYRVESSRSRASGGAGLGLAICRTIAEAHEGSISALPSPLGGVWIKVELPLTEKMG